MEKYSNCVFLKNTYKYNFQEFLVTLQLWESLASSNNRVLWPLHTLVPGNQPLRVHRLIREDRL